MNNETPTVNPKKAKFVKTDSLRVKRETKKKIITELAEFNRRKKIGRNLTVDDYVQLAISFMKPDSLETLRDRTLSNKDRLELRYQEYCVSNGKVSKDEFYGILLSAGNGASAEK